MAFGLKLQSIFFKERAARTVLENLDEVEDHSIVIRDTGRRGIELRGTFRSRPVMVRICLVWTGCGLTMKSRVLGDGGFRVARDHQMDRDAYAAWEKDKDPEWDGAAGTEVRRYLGQHAYIDRESILGQENPWRKHDAFRALPDDLQQAIIAAVDQDRYGRVHLLREELKFSVAERIFNVSDPVALICGRLDLAARVLDACEARVSAG